MSLFAVIMNLEELMVHSIKELGAEVVLMRLKRSRETYGICKMVELIRGLKEVLRSYNPGIIHIQYLAPGFLPIVAARLSGIRSIFATVHIAGDVAYGLKAKMLLRTAAMLTTAFICVSRGVEQFWFGTSAILDPGNIGRGRKHFTIYNAIDIAEIEQVINGIDYEELKRSLGIARKKVVGIVARAP